MGRFSGIENAQMSEGGVFFLPGNYLARIDTVKTKTSRKNDLLFIIETTILWSDVPERRRGSSCTQMYKAGDAFLGNVKHFCSVANDCDPSEVDDAGVELVCGDENPLQGTILRLQAVNIKTKALNDFTKVIWKQVSAEDQVLLAKAA